MTRARYYVFLGIAFFLALALRIAVVERFEGLAAPPDTESAPDQREYELFTYHLSVGEGYTLESGAPSACRSPGTSLTLLPVYLVAGRSFFWGRIWFCFLSALTCVATAEVARLLFSPVVGLVAAVWLGLYPAHFYYPVHFLSEVPFGLYLVLACGMTALALRHERWFTALAAGLLWGMAVLTRPQILPAVPLLAAASLLSVRFARLHSFKQLGVLVAALVVVVSPWIIRNAIVMGKPTLTTIVGGYGFWLGNNELVLTSDDLRGTCADISQLLDDSHPLVGNEVEREAAAWRYGLEFVKTHRIHMPRLCLAKMWRFLTPFRDTSNILVYWTFAAAWIASAPFMCAGIALSCYRDFRTAIVFLAPFLAMAAVTVVFYGLDRYRDGLAPLIAIFVAAAVVEMIHSCQRLANRAGRETIAPRVMENGGNL